MNSYGEAFAAFYDDQFGDYAEKVAPLLLHFFSSQPLSETSSRVLDLGCGTGRVALHFLEAGYSFTGLDLSPDMLALARIRCSHLVAGRNAAFVQGDFSEFDLEDNFGLVVSTFNAINHLESRANLLGCFQSVRRCLAGGGWFLFDYHTKKGLREWTSSESFRFERGEVKTVGSFDEEKGLAVLKLHGSYGDFSFDETIRNVTFPLPDLEGLLKKEGFGKIIYSRMDDLGYPVSDPENEFRVVVMAS